MKEFCTLFFFGLITIFFVSCSSAGPASNAQISNSSTFPNSTVYSNGNVNIRSFDNSNVNTSDQSTGLSRGDVNAVSNSADSNMTTGSMFDRRKARMEAMRNAGTIGQTKIDEADLLKKSTRPAPEDSEYAIILTDKAIEVRTFKSHPQLLKVEKRSDGKKSTIKIYLKNGKVVEIAGDKITAIRTEPAAHILELSGIQDRSKAQK